MTESTGDDLEEAFAEARDRIETALDATEDGALPDEESDAVHERVQRLADGISDASVDELLGAIGVEDVPEDASVAELPSWLQSADPDAVVELRRLLKLAALGNEWTDLDADERHSRLERAVGRSDTTDESRSVADLLSSVWSDETDEADEDTGETDDGGDETTAEEDADRIESLRSALATITGEVAESDGGASDETEAEDGDAEVAEDAEADEDAEVAEDTEADEDAEVAEDTEADEDAEADEESDRSRTTDDQSRHSTVPSKRFDMGRSTRFSSIRARK